MNVHAEVGWGNGHVNGEDMLVHIPAQASSLEYVNTVSVEVRAVQ